MARRLVDDVVTASVGTTVVYITHRDEELAATSTTWLSSMPVVWPQRRPADA